MAKWLRDITLGKEWEQSQQKFKLQLQQFNDSISGKFGHASGSSSSSRKYPLPLDRKTEVISIVEEYNTLPQYVRENFPFKDYIDMHPKTCHKVKLATKEYHAIVDDMFSCEEEDLCQPIHVHDKNTIMDQSLAGYAEERHEDVLSFELQPMKNKNQSSCGIPKEEITLDQEETHNTPLIHQVDHKMEGITIMDQSIRDAESMSPRSDTYSNFCNSSSSHVVSSISHEGNEVVESSYDGTQVKCVAHEIYIVDSNHKGSDCVYPTLEDVKKAQETCNGWSHRAKKAKMLAAQARQHLQEVKERCNQLDNARRQRESYIRSLFLPREESEDVEHTREELLEVSPQEEHVEMCDEEKSYDLENSVWSSLHHEVYDVPLLKSPLKAPNNDDISFTLDGPATSVIFICVEWNIIDSDLVSHASSTMEGQLLRSYEVSCLKEMIRETKRLLTKKILHFDNVWFVWHTTPWSLLVMENILVMEIEVWIRFWAAKAVNRTCYICLNTPHGPAPLEESPTLEGEAREDRKNIVERYEHTSDFLTLNSNSRSSHESNFEPWVGYIQVGVFKCEVDPSLPRVDDILSCIPSGPATKSLSLLRIRNSSHSSMGLSPLPYDGAAMYLLIEDSDFLNITLGFQDQNIRDFVGYMVKQNIYLTTFNEGTLICGNMGKVAAAVWRTWKSIQQTFLADDWLICEFLTALVVGSNCGFIWSEVLSWLDKVQFHNSNIMSINMPEGCVSAKIWDLGINMCWAFLQWIHVELLHFWYTDVYIRVAQWLGGATFLRSKWDSGIDNPTMLGTNDTCFGFSHDGIHTSSSSLSSTSIDMAVVSLLIGDSIVFDSLWTSGCPSWNHLLLDLALTTSMIQYEGIEECFFATFVVWHWYDDVYDIIQVAGQNYSSIVRWSCGLEYWFMGVHFHTLLVCFIVCMFHGVRLRYFFISFSTFGILVWDPGPGLIDTLVLQGPNELLHHLWFTNIYIRVTKRQHGGSLLRRNWNPGITWICSSIVEDVEANVGLLEFLPLVFQFGSLGEQFIEELTELVQYLIALPSGGFQEVTCLGAVQDSVSRRWNYKPSRMAWDPGIILGYGMDLPDVCGVGLTLLEDKQSLGREDCHVPQFLRFLSANISSRVGLLSGSHRPTERRGNQPRGFESHA